jgi:UTP:GlnB (protein PII) uridylyltransferase
MDLRILEAEIFTRRLSPTANEAVDLFWITRSQPFHNIGITSNDVRRLGQCLVERLRSGGTDAQSRPSTFVGRSADCSARVSFIEDPTGGFTTLELEADDRSGLLLEVCQCLFAADLQIVGSRIKSHQGRARGRFELLSRDERPIEAERRHGIQLAVLSALERSAGEVTRSAAG